VQLPLKPLMGEAFAASGSFAPALWVGIGCALGSAVLVLLLPRREQPPTLRRPSEAGPLP
jgi:hypothetical protein